MEQLGYSQALSSGQRRSSDGGLAVVSNTADDIRDEDMKTSLDMRPPLDPGPNQQQK